MGSSEHHARPAAEPMGWCEYVDLPDRGVKMLRAEVDTGACSSSLRIDNVEELPRGRVAFDPVAIGVRGIFNVLRHLAMAEVESRMPSYQTVVENTRWIRAPRGGLLRFHVGPGDLVHRRDPIATIDSLGTWDSYVVKARQDGIIIGMPTMPAVKPGDPICHIASPETPLAEIERRMRKAPDSLHRQVQADQASGMKLAEPDANGGLTR